MTLLKVLRMRFFELCLLLPLVVAALPALASTDVTAPVATQPANVVINGFRAAHFGMDQEAVTSAIKTDFGLHGSSIRTAQDPVMETSMLSITEPGLVPQSGDAEIEYVFGYKSHLLTEVNITWKADGTGNSATSLLHTGAGLQTYFESEAFPSGNITGNKLLANGALLLFRGIDSAGHAVVLALSGKMQADNTAKKTVMTPEVLTLIYAADPGHPDVFHIPSGSF